jgi:hypothetical protein
MTSSYLTRPIVPLAVLPSRLLEQIEAELADDQFEATEEEHLRWRAELICALLTIAPHANHNEQPTEGRADCFSFC